ncbi:MAG: NAD(P)/FAD-dependent oxidoreductase [Verrucomicrobiota bacterium]
MATQPPLDLAVIGGGASGFFTALQYAEIAPAKSVAIFEKGSHFLQKVRISGGGRCNVTHACFDPGEMSKNYPRGSKELRAAFHRWQPSDTIEWFKRQGVELKAEPDGRMFPVTDRSETVIDCFLERARKSRIALYQKYPLIGISLLEDRTFSLQFENLEAPVTARTVCMATGSLKGSSLLQDLKKLEQTLQPLVPSLFAFNVSDRRISGLAGVSHPHVSIRREGTNTPRQGPILITHRGFSGPAVLRLSAWEARELAETNHHFPFIIDWLPEMKPETIQAQFDENRRTHGAKLVRNSPIPPLPRRLWERIVACCEIEDQTTWGQLPKAAVKSLLDGLKSARFEAEGKTTNKDEFVTCGGIERKTIDFRTMQSRHIPGLYFVGECIDIDGITGGFNFQAAWTTAHIAATDIATR